MCCILLARQSGLSEEIDEGIGLRMKDFDYFECSLIILLSCCLPWNTVVINTAI